MKSGAIEHDCRCFIIRESRRLKQLFKTSVLVCGFSQRLYEIICDYFTWLYRSQLLKTCKYRQGGIVPNRNYDYPPYLYSPISITAFLSFSLSTISFWTSFF